MLDWLIHRDVVVITSTDITSEGKLGRSASSDHPVYYEAVCVGYRDFGGTMAGDKPPKSPAMIRTVAKALAKAGFLPADRLHPPSQVIVFAWGTLYPNRIPNLSDPNLPDIQTNRSAMLRFLGGDKLGLVNKDPNDLSGPPLSAMLPHGGDADDLENAATDDLYVVVLSGYEEPKTRSFHPKLLWSTKISCPSTGLVMDETLPTMLALAAPNIGHETAQPVWTDASKELKPKIEIGNPKVEEFLDSGPLPVFEVTPPPAKKPIKGR